jgi:hypothetical protein
VISDVEPQMADEKNGFIDPFNKSHNALFSAFDVKFILFNFIEKNKFQKNTFDVEGGKYSIVGYIKRVYSPCVCRCRINSCVSRKYSKMYCHPVRKKQLLSSKSEFKKAYL